MASRSRAKLKTWERDLDAIQQAEATVRERMLQKPTSKLVRAASWFARIVSDQWALERQIQVEIRRDPDWIRAAGNTDNTLSALLHLYFNAVLCLP